MSGTSSGDIDVVLTCYNEGPFIGQAVRSVLEQTAAERIAHIVIADDGSADDTLAVLGNIVQWDPRIEVIFGEGGVGPARQRNRAAARCDSAYIAYLDGDDHWTTDRLARQAALLDADPGIGLVYSDYFAFSSDAPGAARQAHVADLSDRDPQGRAYFLCDPPILPSTTLLRREILDRAGGFDPDLRMFEETDLWFRIASISRFGFVDAPLAYKRYHTQSMTGGQRDLMPDHARVAFRAVEADPHLLPLLPRRLSERARKLGNHRFVQGERAEAARLLGLALRLDPLNHRVWPAWLAVLLAPGLTERAMGRRLARRRRAFGVDE